MPDELEKFALKRDRRFLFRLIAALFFGFLASIFVFDQLTSADVGGCAARSFGVVTESDLHP